MVHARQQHTNCNTRDNTPMTETIDDVLPSSFSSHLGVVVRFGLGGGVRGKKAGGRDQNDGQSAEKYAQPLMVFEHLFKPEALDQGRKNESAAAEKGEDVRTDVR